MRTFPSALATALTSGAAIDAAILATVAWGGTNVIKYSDRTLIEDISYLPFIVEVGELDSSQNSDSSGATNAITLTLSDVDGSLKNIIDTNDIHKNPVTISLYIIGTGTANSITLFNGLINTPIIWSEGKRTLTFDVITSLEDFEVGFSLDMAPVQNLPYKLMGKPFPMVFGTVMHVPALQLQEIPSAFTTLPFSIPDYNLPLDMQKIQAQINALKVNFADVCVTITFFDKGCNQDDANEAAMTQGAQNQVTVDNLTLQLRALNLTLAFQGEFYTNDVPIIPTMQVTQPFTGTLRVGNQLFEGTLHAPDPVTGIGGHIDCTEPLLQPGNYSITLQLTKAGYIFNNAGSQVQICGPYPLVYVASIVPGTVTGVYAFHSFRGLRQITKVPPSYYTTQVNNYGVPCWCVTLNQPLSTTAFLYNLYWQNWETNFGQYLPGHLINAIDWDDDLYITFESSIGPNPVDIMIYLIDTYSQNTYDSTSFNTVKATVATIPMNFLYQSLTNVMELLTQIAYQCRCAIYLQENVFFLVNLSSAGTAVDSISESDVNVGTLEVSTTSTESLVTVYESSFRPDYSPIYDQPVKSIFRFNVNKYGYHTENHDFFCYNSFAVVEKISTFWMIRKSMTWKILKCQLYLHKLNLEIFDTVLLNFARTYVSTSPVLGMIQNAKYNTTDKTYDVEIWVPVRLGEMVPYTNAWLIPGEEQDFFPTYIDIQAGSAGGQGGGNPIAMPPANGFQPIKGLNDRNNFTQGDKTPLSNNYTNDDGDPDVPSGTPGIYTPTPGAGFGPHVYQFPGAAPPPAAIPELSRTYPGKIVMYLGDVATSQGPGQYYLVTIYRKGVLNATGTGPGDPGVLAKAVQLQIDPNDRIPPGASIYIMENQYNSGTIDPATKATLYFTERMIQVPIFLR